MCAWLWCSWCKSKNHWNCLFIIQGCATIDGLACIFPFQYNGTSYNNCIKKNDDDEVTYDEDDEEVDEPWCPYDVTDNGEAGNWNYCNSNCGKPSKTSFVSLSLCENYYNDIQSFLDLPYSRKFKHVLLFMKSEILLFKVWIRYYEVCM